MSYFLGIDVGTSFTAASVCRVEDGAALPAEPVTLGTRSTVVPSVLYLGADGQVLAGESAERRGAAEPERVVREFKRRIGDTVPIAVGDRLLAPEDAFATMVRWVVDQVGEREGGAPEGIVLTHPAHWGPYKTAVVTDALAGAGLTDVHLLTEPEAAALHYAAQERVEVGSTIAVYDLGGGTFDAAVVRKHDEDAFEVLGRPDGVDRLGGVDFDEAVLAHVLASIEDVPELDPEDPAALAAMSRLRRECTEAKEALSFDCETAVPVLLPGAQAQVRLVRAELEAMIEPHVHQTVAVLDGVVRDAGVDREDLAAVLLVGGSSRVPLVAELLSGALGRPIAVDTDPKASIALGAALSASTRVALGAEADAAPEEPVAVARAAAVLGEHADAWGTTGGYAAQRPGTAAHPRPVLRGARAAAVAVAVLAITVVTAVVGQAPIREAVRPLADAVAELGSKAPAGELLAALTRGTTAAADDGAEQEEAAEDAGTAKSVTKVEKPTSSPSADSAAPEPRPSETGGEPSPSGTPSSSPRPSPSSDPSPSPTGSPSPSASPTPSPSAPAPSPTASPTTSPSPSPSPSSSPTSSPSPSPSPTSSPTTSPSPSPSPTSSPTTSPSPSPSPTSSPSASPSPSSPAPSASTSPDPTPAPESTTGAPEPEPTTSAAAPTVSDPDDGPEE